MARHAHRLIHSGGISSAPAPFFSIHLSRFPFAVLFTLPETMPDHPRKMPGAPKA